MLKGIGKHIESGAARRLGGEMGWVVAGQALTALALVLGVRVLTGILAEDIYGEIAVGLGIANLFAYLVGMELGSSATRFFSVSVERKELKDFFATLVRWGSGALVLGLLLLVPIAPIFLSGTGTAGLVLTVLLGCLMAADYVFNGIQHASRNRRVVAFQSILSNWGRIGLAVLLVMVLGTGSYGVVFAGFCGALLVGQLSQIYFLRRSILKPYAEAMAPVSGRGFCSLNFPSYFLPRLLVGGLTWVQLFSDRLFLSHFADNRGVGIYFAVYQLSFIPMLMLSGLVATFFMPIIFQRAGSGSDANRYHDGLKQNEMVSVALAVLVAAAVAACFLLHGWVACFCLSEPYREYSWLMPWMVASGGLYSIGNQFLGSLQLSMNQNMVLLQKFIATVFALAGYGIGAKVGGVFGAVCGGLVFTSIHCVVSIALHFWLKAKVSGQALQEDG